MILSCTMWKERNRTVVDLSVESRINTFMLNVIDSSEYLSVEYLVFSIRKQFLNYMNASRLKQFEIPAFLDPLVDTVLASGDKGHLGSG